MNELKEGIWIAQGPEMNLLIRVVGKSPLLEIVGAVNLNAFYKEGKVENLSKDSIEILDILSCPEKYQFCEPSITDTIRKEGIDQTSGKKCEDIKEDEFQKLIRKYKELHSFYKPGEAETRFILWLKKEHNIAISQGKSVVARIKASFQKPLVEHDALNRTMSEVK